jgi:hypothetical protein
VSSTSHAFRIPLASISRIRRSSWHHLLERSFGSRVPALIYLFFFICCSQWPVESLFPRPAPSTDFAAVLFARVQREVQCIYRPTDRPTDRWISFPAPLQALYDAVQFWFRKRDADRPLGRLLPEDCHTFGLSWFRTDTLTHHPQYVIFVPLNYSFFYLFLPSKE